MDLYWIWKKSIWILKIENFSQHGGSNIEGRFGGDSEPKVSGSTTTITGQDGKYTQTHHKLGTDGKWHADSTHRGSFNG